MIDNFENERSIYVVLEYLNGGDLYDFMLKRGFDLPEKMGIKFSYMLCCSLSYLHSYGIVHRDLKLENIMMTARDDTGIPKLVDFGLAKIIGPDESASEPFGTVAYAAPEVNKGSHYTKMVDVWSIGVIMYALLSGTLPFEGRDQKETAKLVIEKPLSYRSPKWPNIPLEAKDLVTKMLIKDPDQRITLDEVLENPWIKQGEFL